MSLSAEHRERVQAMIADDGGQHRRTWDLSPYDRAALRALLLAEQSEERERRLREALHDMVHAFTDENEGQTDALAYARAALTAACAALTAAPAEPKKP